MLVDNSGKQPVTDDTRISPRTADTHPLRSRIGDFIASLRELEKEPITTARVSTFLAATRPSAGALAPYTLWCSERYARNLIYRDQFFEVLALCWLPGQQTPVHTHNGQLGWVTMVQGELACHNYRFVRPPSEELSPQKKLPLPSHSSAEGRRVDVELVASTVCVDDGSVAVVDRRQTTHQLANLERSRRGSVSLHIYSKPIDQCVLFDETSRCCERRQLQYHSVNGIVRSKAA